jgi:hypothetical protein
VDDTVLLKSDGFPTYHLASVVDDSAMAITHVIRGQEWLPSTPKHLVLYRALGLAPPRIAHLPLLLNEDRSKLSKRHGDAAVEDFAAAGYLPEALVNFVALLGWSPPEGSAGKAGSASASGSASQAPVGDVLSLDDIVRLFDLSSVHKANAIVDRKRLDHFNREHIKRKVVGAVGRVAPDALQPASAPGPGPPPAGGGGGGGGGAHPAKGKWAGKGPAGAAAAAVKPAAPPQPSSPPSPFHVRPREGHLPTSIPETPEFAEIRAAVLPPLDALLAALRADGGGAGEMGPSAKSVADRVPVERLNALLLAQHERATVFRDMAPLLAPFVADAREFAGLVRRGEAEAAEAATAAAAAVTPGGSAVSAAAGTGAAAGAPAQAPAAPAPVDLGPALASTLSAWEALSPSSFAEGGKGMEAARAAAKAGGVPVGRLIFALRGAVTGMETGPGMPDALRLLGRDVCVERLRGSLARKG